MQSNLVEMNFRGPTKFVLIIRSSSYQDIVIHVQYYSKPNRARNVVCTKQKFVLGVYFFPRFYCTYMRMINMYIYVINIKIHTMLYCRL